MEKSVEEFANKCADIVAEFERESFLDAEHDYEGEITSPIERILYFSIKTLGIINDVGEADPLGPFVGNFTFGGWEWPKDNHYYIWGLNIQPQVKIGKYRIDFAVSYSKTLYGKLTEKTLLVECDSQEWHERTESERRYEKARDRYLQTKG